MQEIVLRAKSKGKTISQIIKKSGIGRTSFYGIMAGKQVPKLDTAIRIAKALDTQVDEVFPLLREVLRND